MQIKSVVSDPIRVAVSGRLACIWTRISHGRVGKPLVSICSALRRFLPILLNIGIGILILLAATGGYIRPAGGGL
jgi:hypothetical protein